MADQLLHPSLTVAPSAIDGIGIHAVTEISPGKELGETHLDLRGRGGDLWRTGLGTFINDSNTPNCFKYGTITEHGTVYRLVTYERIEAGEELTVKYSLVERAAPDE